MSKQDKNRLEVRVKESVENTANTKILQGLRDIISKSEYIEGNSLKSIDVTTMINEKIACSRYVSVMLDKNGRIDYIQVAEKDADGKFIDKVCSANFFKDVPLIDFGQKYSIDQAESVAKQMLESMSGLFYSFEHMREARAYENVATDNGVYYASAKYKRMPNCKGNYISEVDCTLLIDNNFYKTQQLNFFYYKDRCLISSIYNCNEHKNESMPMRLKSLLHNVRGNDKSDPKLRLI